MIDDITAEEMAAQLNVQRILLASGSQLAVGILRGTTFDVADMSIVDTDAECLEIGTIGQVFNPDGTPVFDDQLEPQIAMSRLYIRLDAVPGLLEDIQKVLDNKGELIEKVREMLRAQRQDNPNGSDEG